MNDQARLQTWEVLQEFGFQPDAAEVYSDIRPGLSFDFGNFKLSAVAVLGQYFEKVVLLSGVLSTPRTLSEIQFEMPREIESRERCAAWLAWSLEKHRKDLTISSPVALDWMKLGRANLRLLPWYFDREAYAVRPQCSVDTEQARLLLKSLAKIAQQMPPDEKVWFSFDGEVLKIRAGEQLLAIAAKGTYWPNQYGLRAGQLIKPPRQLPRIEVLLESWEDHFTIARRRYMSVDIQSINTP